MGGRARHLIKVDASLYLHATEDEEKVMGSLEGVLGIRRDELSVNRTSGHYGNPITIVRATLFDDRALEVLREMVAHMDDAERRRLSRSLRDLIDERGRIYIRLDKQGLVMGRARMGHRDSVELVVSSEVRREEPAMRLSEILGSARNED